MTELKDEACTPNKSTVLLAYSSNASQKKSYSRRNGNMRNWGRGSYPSRQKRNSDIYSHYYASGHIESNWVKLLEEIPWKVAKYLEKN